MSEEIESVAAGQETTPFLLAVAQDELQRSHQRFLAVFESSADAILLFDDERYIDANPAASALLELPREELLGRPVTAFAPRPEIVREHLEALARTGWAEGQGKVVTATGCVRDVEFRARANILPGLHLSMVRDITERKAADAARARLAAIVESSGDAIIGLNRDGLVEDWNRAAEKLYGYTAEEALGATTELLVPPERLTEWRLLRERAWGGEVIANVETTRVRKDGVHIDVSLTLSPIRDVHGKVVGCSKMVRDISGVKRADHQLRALLDSAPDGMVVIERGQRVAFVNRAASLIFGYSREELIGAPLDALLPEALRERHRDFFESGVRLEGMRAPEGSAKARRKDGSYVDVEISLSPFKDLHGAPLTIAAVRDVSEQKRLRDQLVLSDRMASLGTLAAGVAHEINNPLAAVTANLDIAVGDLEEAARRAPAFDELRDAVADAREAAERIRQIVRDLKIFSRAEDERLCPIDVHSVLESTLRMARNEIRHRAGLVKEFSKTPRVMADESRLGQVFLNLIINAAQAIPEGNAAAHRILVKSWHEGDTVMVSVTDTGVGMPPEVLRQLFTPFFTTKPRGVGTGLGLSICHRLITGFGGQIFVESRVGEGTTFRIALPATAEPATHGSPPPPVPARRRGRILVVDDEPMIGLAVARIFSQEHDIVTVTRGRDALERLTGGEHFDVVLCDVMMPEMDGAELYEEIAKAAPEQIERIVFLTGGAFTLRAREFLEATRNARIDKPFDPLELRALVNERIR